MVRFTSLPDKLLHVQINKSFSRGNIIDVFVLMARMFLLLDRALVASQGTIVMTSGNTNALGRN